MVCKEMPLPVESLTSRNFLSFGPEAVEIRLHSLNLLIGTNGAGKSNLIEAISLMASTPGDLSHFFRIGGGSSHFIWKGGRENQSASVEILGKKFDESPFRHSLSFAISGQSYEVTSESIFEATPSGRLSNSPSYSMKGATAVARINRKKVLIPTGVVGLSQSAISGFQPFDIDRSFRSLQRTYQRFEFYRARLFNQIDSARKAQNTDSQNGSLDEDGSNLAAVIARLLSDKSGRRTIDRYMSAFYEGYESLSVQVQAGTMLIYLHERGLRSPIPATRLSDGTLRWLALLAILADPHPAPLICIEEPETALHPDILVDLAQLLREASERCQLIVTTHSDTLVDAFTKTPECVLVCEKADGATTLKRLDREELKGFLEVYSLGPLWRRNLIGGVR